MGTGHPRKIKFWLMQPCPLSRKPDIEPTSLNDRVGLREYSHYLHIALSD
jgi:hypothetical protein